MILYAYTTGYIGKYYEIPRGIYQLDALDSYGTIKKIRLEVYNPGDKTRAMKVSNYKTFIEEGDEITTDIITNIPENWAEKTEGEAFRIMGGDYAGY